MRKATLVAVLVVTLLVITAGIALADSFRSTEESDRIEGLAGNDNLFGRRGDTIFGDCEVSKGVTERARGPTVRRGSARVFGSLEADVLEVL